MTQYQQFLGSPDIFEKATGQRITEEQAKTAGLFTPARGLICIKGYLIEISI